MAPMNPAEAEAALVGTEELVPCLAAPVADAKELLGACLEADIPAVLDRDDSCGHGGCACPPKLCLLVRPDDVQRVANLLRDRWHALAEREGLEPVTAVAADETGEHLPCPACGVAAPLEGGACKDCGLQLE